ncbi:DUF2513 domain-containing protein [Mesobacillus zeae]|uniref:DUF2513 domain-containing protein n=1 Tax=Mesobacillus zeae TaxID=1917180 RepID=UPI003008374C
MKLNHDCVRALLLVVEDDTSGGYLFLRHLKAAPSLSAYSDDEILYTASKLREAGFVHAKPVRGSNKIMDMVISEITWEGHEFLDNIRDHKVWKATKEATSKVASTSITIVADVAKSYISKKLGLS